MVQQLINVTLAKKTYPKKAKIKAKKDALTVYKCYTGNNSPKKRKSQAKKKCR